ncbi:MAG: hypothetical protein JWM78_3430 [Verrucomicrobiaceae bacterium]|nr:hypothetical protein [Verrucomicrobiaceae bacterium]
MLGILTDPEIQELTRWKRRDKQIIELRKMGVRFLVRSDGSIAVARAHIESLLGVNSKQVPREPQLRF